MVIVLLKSRKEERLILAHRTARRESDNVVAEHRLRTTVQLVHIRNGIEPLRLVAPQQRPVQTIGAGFGHDIENTAARAAELHAEVARLDGNFFNGIGNREDLLLAAYKGIVVFGPVQQIIVPARALAVDGKTCAIVGVTRSGAGSAAPNGAPASLRRAW